LKNFNPKVKELRHSLSTTNDSLLITCEKTIYKVEIFNEDYENIITVDGFEAKIPLNELPFGRFVVEVKLGDKIVVMHLIKRDYTDISSSALSAKTEEVFEGQGMMLDEQLKVIKSAPKRSVEFLLTRKKVKKNTPKKQKLYWTVSEINNDHASRKTMKLVDKESVDRMILKNKIEKNSVSGRLNELTVWEVYNTTEFMKNQMSNPDFIYSQASDSFNAVPYYTRENGIQSL
jgi:hypothetical protein